MRKASTALFLSPASRPKIAMAVSALLFAAGLARADDLDRFEKTFDERVKPFLSQYCVRCHNVEEMTSGVRVDHLDGKLDDRQIKVWEHALKKVRAGEMPPEDAEQPTAADRLQAVEWMDQALKIARSRPTPKNGSVRRLTIAQYRNTLRELLLLEDDLVGVLPPDAVSRDGFVNNQETLQFSPLALDAYFDIAEQALARTLVDPAAKPTIQNFRVDLGAGINTNPVPERLILGDQSLLLDKADYVVEQLTAKKPFPFTPFVMQTKFRFIEGYAGNDTVRGWRDFDSIYHAVFADMRGTRDYPKGLAYSTVPEGLLLRPATPTVGGDFESNFGPRANFKIALRELPSGGRFRVSVTAAKYDDGLLLDPGTPTLENDDSIVSDTSQELSIEKAGIYQVDVYAPPAPAPQRRGRGRGPGGNSTFTLELGSRHFSGNLTSPAFLVVRLPAGTLRLKASRPPDRIVLTPLPAEHDLAKQFVKFESRAALIGVHVGFRRDCGSTLAPVGAPQIVNNLIPQQFVFEGAIDNFPNPNVEEDNVNYLAGIREIGVRSEYTDDRDVPRLLIRSVEFEGPYYESWPPESHQRIFTGTPEETPAYARKVIGEFAARAFRRPVAQREVDALVAVFRKSMADGETFQNAVKDALHVTLISPQFLLLVENSSSPEPEQLDEFELASKLSYFLINGPPDATTLELAATGKLRERLNTEVDRLIDDPRFSRFTEEFVSQWLALDKFDVLEVDRRRFPKLMRETRKHLRREPIEFFQYLVRNNLPARNLIASHFVVANDVVANYYGLSSDSGFRFEPIVHGRRYLGGYLAQSAILAGLSDGREPNPVKRGAWLARRIIAEPPDDPPPNVPALDEDTKSLPLRERLERHRSQPGCMECHTKIDPWGVPLEEFNAAGLFQQEINVDARSTLPDKTEVADFIALRSYLADDRIDQVAFSALKHLMTYAAGRSLTYAELEFLRTDAMSLKPDGYRMRDLIHYVVTSKVFLEK
jgi:hypothetical protein